MPTNEYPRNMGEGEYAAVRARLGMPVRARGRVRLDLIGRMSPKKAAPALPAVEIAALPAIPVLPNYAPFNFIRPAGGEAIIRLVALKHGVSYREILGASRTKGIMAARREAVRLVKSHCRDASSVQIGRLFHKDHSSILNLLGRKSRGRTDA
jgi:hypothetical protein